MRSSPCIKYTFEYTVFNDKDIIVESNHFNFEGVFGIKNTYKCDENGYQIEVNYYNSNGSFFIRMVG